MSPVQDLTIQASFVFEAQVEQVGASVVSGFPASSETAVVSISTILKSSPALAGYSGKRITVQLQPPVSLRAGQRFVFFTEGLYYGDGLVVRELGNVPASEPAMEAQVKNAIQAGDDSDMMQRVAQAVLVVSGTASEHDPDYHRFTITIETVEKGASPGQTIEALFPNSNDIAWYRSPKVKAGDHGVWLLHNRDLFGNPVPVLAVVHPLDFRPIGELERVRTLLKRP